MSGPLLLPLCTFGRVFDTVPLNEVLTLSELTEALRRFEVKTATATKIERDVARIRQGAARLARGETPRGKFMGKLHKVFEQAKKRGEDPHRAIESHAEYLIQEARKSAKRDLRLWSPALYRPGADKRGKEGVTHVSCLVLDYDDGTSVKEASTTWSTFFHLVYTTWSHAPNHPKFRLVMPLSFAVPSEDWSKVWSWAEETAHFTIDPSMKSPAATYALPAVPHRDWPREAFSRPGAILDPVDEGILERRSRLELTPRRPLSGEPSVFRGEDPEKEYLDQRDPEAVYFVDEEWEEEEHDWEASPDVVQATRSREREPDLPPPTRAPIARENPEETRDDMPTEVRRASPADASVATSASLDKSSQDSLQSREPPAAAAPARGVVSQDSLTTREAPSRAEVATPPASSEALWLVEGLERLVALHREGFLTSDELTLAKHRILSPDEPGDLRRVGPGRHRRTLCLDFDGVIHAYESGWRGPTEIPDPPVEGAIAWMTQAAEQYDLAIHSVRNAFPGAVEAMRAWLQRHGLDEHVLSRLRFPLHKPPAELYLDDRGLRFEGRFPALEELGELEPWNRPRKRR